MSSNWLIVDATFAVLLSATFAMVNKDDCAAMKKIREANGYDWTKEENRWVKDPSTHDTKHTCHVNTNDAAGSNRQWWGYVLCSAEEKPEPVKCGWAANVKLIAKNNGYESTIRGPKSAPGSCHTTGRCECNSNGGYMKGAAIRAMIGPLSLDNKGKEVTEDEKKKQECADRETNAEKAKKAMQADPEFPPNG